MRLPFLFGSVLVVAAACTPSPRGHVDVQVSLSPEDRELLERLVEGETPSRQELAPLTVPTIRKAPPEVKKAPEKTERRRVEEGPILQASYDAGTPLYDGAQVATGEGWERQGDWKAWHTNGQLWEEGAYLRGKEDGPWRWWYEDGTPQASGTFVDGAHVGPWTFYHANGQVMAEGAYEDDRPIGRWVTYYEDGTVRSEGGFLAGKRSGRWTFRDEEGLLDRESSGLYEDGERIGD